MEDLGDLERSPDHLVGQHIEEDDGCQLPEVGSSRCSRHEQSDPTSSCLLNQNDQGAAPAPAKEIDMNLDNEPLVDLERGAIHSDIQHKRARILGYYEECDSLTTSVHGIDSSSLVASATVKQVQGESLFPAESMTVIYYHLDDDGTECFMDPDSKNNSDVSSDSDGDNAEVRMDLTEDLLHMVLSFLSLRDLCMAGATCKQWHIASSHEEFWRCLNLEDLSITPENFASICHRYPNATLVNILGVPEFDILSMQALTSLRKLQCLSLGKGQEPLDDDFFNVLTDCPSLKSLTIQDASLGSTVQEITVHHDKLCELQLVKCRAFRISVRCSQLQTLSLRRTSMTQAMLSCPQLLELDISACHKLLDAAIRSATATCSLLTSLDMSFCSCISDETLHGIAFSCPNLQVLDASFCPNVAFESVTLPMLRELKLQSCEGISSASVAAISQSSMLEVLELDFCSLLTSVSLDLLHLKKLSLVHCRNLFDLNLRSPSLLSLKVSNCAALNNISIMSNSLKKLVLQKQESLTTLLLQCQNLQELDLSDCESLGNSVCHIFSGGGCPMIRSLILDNCESLTKVGFNSHSLVNLSLVGCRAMTTIKLLCPNLEKIYLDGCDHLERAEFCPVGLRSLNLGICPKLNSLQIEAENLLVLELQGCGVLSKASIICPLLSVLDASFCSQLKDDSLCAISASCTSIKSLILSSCLSIGFDGLTSLSCLQHLTSLDLSYTFLVDLQPVFESCSQLETLRLMACKDLTNSSLEALYEKGALSALRELDLSYSSVGQPAIEGLLTWCTNLTNVNLNGCANMQDLVWGLSNNSGYSVNSSSSSMQVDSNGGVCSQPYRLLETLNCVGCPNIKRVVFPPSARCFYLSKLNLHLSANLREVNIACPNLVSLNLSHCSSLEILELNCPILGILILLACEIITEAAVETAVSGCSSLETLNLQHCPNIHAMNLGKLRKACPSVKRIHSSLWE